MKLFFICQIFSKKRMAMCVADWNNGRKDYHDRAIKGYLLYFCFTVFYTLLNNRNYMKFVFNRLCNKTVVC